KVVPQSSAINCACIASPVLFLAVSEATINLGGGKFQYVKHNPIYRDFDFVLWEATGSRHARHQKSP
ncbi:hypothetical protein, partial [Pseudomonas sp. NBRC 111144]|uniref:hypothetical protein n=1 Tax=Pseudomonas sp. NBRC 111144 TaxID=1661059 RepID=UPI001C4412F1